MIHMNKSTDYFHIFLYFAGAWLLLTSIILKQHLTGLETPQKKKTLVQELVENLMKHFESHDRRFAVSSNKI